MIKTNPQHPIIIVASRWRAVYKYYSFIIRGDTYILEEAKIDENTIVIDTSKQRILKTDDISFEKRTFDFVVKK